MDVTADRRFDADAPRAADAVCALLAECVRRGASDLHLKPGLAPVFRVGGELVRDPSAPALSSDACAAAADWLLEGCARGPLDSGGAQDGALSWAGARFRFNVYRCMGGLSVAVRLLEDRFRTLAELGLPESLYSLCDIRDGIVVVAGPTGSGKSTTLAALIDRINSTRAAHVITIEDPVEYVHAPARSVVNQRQVGSHTASFPDAMVASLREDPDVILVGESRDLDTIRTAIRAAETGHLVFTTVHAGDTVGAVERLVSVFPADEQAGIRRQLSLVLRAIVAQQLLPRDGPAGGSDGSGSGEGCVGSARQAVACEILIGTPAVANLVASGRSAQVYAAIEGGARAGMQTMEQDLARLVARRIVSEAAAVHATRHPEILKDRVAAVRSAGART
ncbi:MAG: Twitching mobility protein [Planctomycetes bacterium]|nr:Twitching mobility protein [Planctomycetota bacterium]